MILTRVASLYGRVVPKINMLNHKHNLHLYEPSTDRPNHSLHSPKLYSQRTAEYGSPPSNNLADLTWAAMAKYSEDSCGAPTRDRTLVVPILQTVFFGLDVIAFFLRMISKMIRASSGGFGLDDITLVVIMVYPPLVELEMAHCIHWIDFSDWEALLSLGQLRPVSAISDTFQVLMIPFYINSWLRKFLTYTWIVWRMLNMF